MRIIHVAAECSHIAKVGGLADVVYGLAKSQSAHHQIEVVLPKYDTIDYNVFKRLRVSLRDLWSYQNCDRVHNSVWSDKLDGIQISLIEPHHKDYYFSRGQIYGQKDDTTRFLYFCRAVYELLALHRNSIDILHLHDWQTAGIALLLKAFSPIDFKMPRIVYTIHNFKYHGLCTPCELIKIGIRAQDYLYQEALQDPEKLNMINLTKAGLKYSHAITTVSKTYAQEIQTPQGGHGLEDFVKNRTEDLFGILNGIDYDQYNPANDNTLFQRYPPKPNCIQKVHLAKQANKQHLFETLKIPLDQKKPLIITITRIEEQKGLMFFKQALSIAKKENNFTYILLGSTTNKVQQNEFETLKKELKNTTNTHIHLGFSQSLAHLLYAAADFILIPSLFEPCGLTQMIAMRYATLPIAHATGGLKDTIDPDCGFLYQKPNITEFKAALSKAIKIYSNHPQHFQEMQKTALSKDFSFKYVSKAYEKLYLGEKIESNTPTQTIR